uniref:MYB proto-onco like 1 n=1 Tax=Scleropages formosus TaxID=113540 RepID=A0A8C9VIT2_SCLFO
AFAVFISEDEDEDVFSTDPESRDLQNSKKLLCKVKWSREEDDKLKKLVEQHGTDSWRLIASYFPNRTDGQCQHRWQKVLNPELVKGPWTKEEDQRVIELVHKYGPKRWSVIAKHLQGRIGKQCRERWHNHLNPEVKKSSWTEEEDRIIYEAHKRLGNRWAEISKLLPGRTDNSIKNHWNSTMRRKVEHEGYLQDSCGPYKSKAVVKRRPRSCSSIEVRQGQNQQVMGIPGQLSGYSFGSLARQCTDGVQEGAAFVLQPCNDDPHKEQRIKELELLLMSAENEVGRQSAPCHPSRYSSWSDNMTDDTVTTMSSLEDQSVEFCQAEGNQGPMASVQTSPSKFLAVEASAVLSSLQTIPEFAETLDLIDSDPVAWSEVTSFNLSDVVSPEKEVLPTFSRAQDGISEGVGYYFDPTTTTILSDPNKTCSSPSQGKICVINPSIVTKLSTPPSILRKKKRDRRDRSPSMESCSTSFLDATSASPKNTPVKALPFSPSQFFNISGNENLNLDNPALTSTPVCGQKCLLNTPMQKEMTPKHQKENAGFRTPKIRKCILGPIPRTPTPFKNAMAAQEKMYGPLKMVPQPLAFLEEDIREVLKAETGTDIFNRGDMQPEFRAWKQELDAPPRKVRKCLLLDSWGKDCLNVQLFSHDQINSIQVGVLTLRSYKTVIHQKGGEFYCFKILPSSLISYCRVSQVEFRGHDFIPLVTSEWETVVYGKTEDQLIMTEQARKYLSSYTSACTSRALVL